ncbi:MAG: hypothetical protein K9H84_06430 [Bacteroidales bacterium]|nr:hypothetical protein [Bacteroidales bacterium]
MKTILNIPQDVYKKIVKHLMPEHQTDEEAAFLFAEVVEQNESIYLNFRDWYAIKPIDYKSRSPYHFELKQETNSKIIKQAHDLNACIVEFHSHIDQKYIQFSYTDWLGFSEFVPHALWRLKGKPYLAVVVTRNDVDALVWTTPQKPYKLTAIITEVQEITPANNSLKLENNEW